MPTTDNATGFPFTLPSTGGKKVTAAFDGGLISTDGGVLLLAGADKRLGLIDTLAALIPDYRDPDRITHPVADIMRARVFAIACGYEDANDLDTLRHDPAFKMACARRPESGDALASQPTISRLENAAGRRVLIRMSRALVDLWCRSHRRAPRSIILDIDDTADTVHGHQTLALFNAHYDERRFLPIHVYDAATGHCVLTLLRPGRTPGGKEIRGHVRRLIHRIRAHWPDTDITLRGDSHHGRREVMDWRGENGVTYVFGLSGNDVLRDQVFARTDEACVRRAMGDLDVARDYAETRYGAKSWSRPRRVVARIEVTRRGLDIRYVVTSIAHGTAQWLYDSLYCARGQAENRIKWHKSQLAPDRTSCRCPLANQMRLILHTAAYWLMLTVRQAIPASQPLASGDFSTLRLRLLKIAVRIRETASRIRLAFASNCPEAELFRGLMGALTPRPA